jgi:uncharacterized membrane protein YeaQ/YmgE (transglycosylase-associated protein family)
MNTLFWILLFLVLFALVGWGIVGFTFNVFMLLLGGLIIGALARVLVRDTDGMGLGETALAGILGSLGGGLLGSVLGVGTVLTWGISLVCAALLVGLLSQRS